MQTLAVILNVSLSELLTGQRLPVEPDGEGCIRLALELAQRERETLRRSLNRCFGFGFTFIVSAALFHNAAAAPQVFFLLCSGLGIALIVTGFLINNRKAAAITSSVLTTDDVRLRMKTVDELLHFSMKYQTGHKKQHRKAFAALSATLEDAEYAQFSFIADSCTVNGSPGPWHIAAAITGKRILLCGETMRGALLPVYPVTTYDRSNFRGTILNGRRLVLYLQATEIQLDGYCFNAIVDALQEFVCP